jgi:hypothetical protein
MVNVDEDGVLIACDDERGFFGAASSVTLSAEPGGEAFWGDWPGVMWKEEHSEIAMNSFANVEPDRVP